MNTSITANDFVNIDRMFSVESAAKLLAVSPWTIRKWICEGRISSCKLGSRRVIPQSEINRFIAKSIDQSTNTGSKSKGAYGAVKKQND